MLIHTTLLTSVGWRLSLRLLLRVRVQDLRLMRGHLLGLP